MSFTVEPPSPSSAPQPGPGQPLGSNPGTPHVGQWPTTPPPTPLGTSLRWVAVVLLVVGTLVDLAIQTRASGLAATAAVISLCIGLAVAGRVVRRAGRLLLVGASVVSLFLFLRASPWLVAIDVATVAVLVALACSAERDGRFFDTGFGAAARRLCASLGAVVVAPPRAVLALIALLPHGTTTTRRHVWAVVRGLLIAVPILLIVGLCLAWADPVFASMFDLDIDLAPMWGHLGIVGATIWIATGFFVQASRPPVDRRRSTVSLGPVEGLVVIGGLTALYAVFAFSQLAVARRGADYVVRTTGLTYAEYARSGFFQLLWVAALTAIVLVALRSVVRLPTPATRRLFSLLGVAASALTLVIVHAALLRLQLYDDIFGLTLLRFYSSAFAWWLGVVFIVVGVAMATIGRREREWLPTVVFASLVGAVVVLNLINPDATIVEHNVARAQAGEEFDVAYAATLSSDATPALVDAAPMVDPLLQPFLRVELCGSIEPAAVAESAGPTGWNLSLWRADDALRDFCD